MRLFLTLLFLATTAQAEDCKLPEGKKEELKGVIEFSKCIQKRVKDLETENSALRKDLEALQKTLAGFPGELVNVNGRETRFGGQRLDQASYGLPSRSGEGAAFLAVDDKIVGGLCALGCTLSLQMTAEDLRGTAKMEPAALGPCAFRYEPGSGAWSISGCGEPVSGIDGDGKATGDGGGETIASVGAACVLADAEPLRKVDTQDPATDETLGRDRSKVLYLIADSGQAEDSAGRFRCALKLAR